MKAEQLTSESQQQSARPLANTGVELIAEPKGEATNQDVLSLHVSMHVCMYVCMLYVCIYVCICPTRTSIAQLPAASMCTWVSIGQHVHLMQDNEAICSAYCLTGACTRTIPSLLKYACAPLCYGSAPLLSAYSFTCSPSLSYHALFDMYSKAVECLQCIHGLLFCQLLHFSSHMLDAPSPARLIAYVCVSVCVQGSEAWPEA